MILRRPVVTWYADMEDNQRLHRLIQVILQKRILGVVKAYSLRFRNLSFSPLVSVNALGYTLSENEGGGVEVHVVRC